MTPASASGWDAVDASVLALLRRQVAGREGVVVEVGRVDDARAAEVRSLGLEYLAVVDHELASGASGGSDAGVVVADLDDPAAAVDALEATLGDRAVAALCLIGTLEQLRSPTETLRRLRELARRRGDPVLVAGVANPTHVDIVLALLTGRLDAGARSVLGGGRRGYFTPQDLAGVMEATGWKWLDSEDAILTPELKRAGEGGAMLPAGTPAGELVRHLRRQAAAGADTGHFVRAYRPDATTAVEAGDAAPRPEAPFLSVLVRTQGSRPATLQETLLSLAAQHSADFEVLVLAHDVDGAALVAIEAQVAEFHESFAQRVRVVPVEGGGRAHPLNVGARMARGRYLATLDDDDLAFANWVGEFLAAEGRGPGRVLRLNVATQQVVGRPGAWNGDDGYDTVSAARCDYPATFDLVDHLVDNLTPNNGYAVPRSLATGLHVEWDESLPVLEDWDHLLRSALWGGVESTPEVGALLRAWVSGATSKTAHSEEVWGETRTRILDERDDDPLLLDRGSASRLRHLMVSESEARREVERLESLVRATKDSVAASTAALDQTLRGLEATERRLDEVLTSTSWRLMAGARRVSGAIRRVIRPRAATGGAGPDGRGPVAPRIVPPTTDRTSYERWVRLFDSLDRASLWQLEERLRHLQRPPLISVVVPVYNPPPEYLRAAVESVRAQVYSHWELCIADDCSTDPAVAEVLAEVAESDKRIKVLHRTENGHISAASNSALDIALGEWVALMDHDDVLAPHALAVVALALADRPDTAVVYSDEDKIDDGGHRFDPYFKSDFDPLLLLGQNYMAHLLVARRSLVQRVGGFRLGFEGAQDWDLVLRLTEIVEPAQVAHIPHVLYHWRAHRASTAEALAAKPYAPDAGRRAVEEHVARQELAAEVTTIAESGHNRVTWNVPDPAPKVSVIVPTRDGRYLEQCIKSVLSVTDYPNFELLVVDNGSEDPATLELLATQRDPRFRVRRDPRPFNYSAINNAAVADVDGELLCLLNDDTEVVTASWLSEMVGHVAQPRVGAVGAKLYYGDGTIQHAGVVLGIGGVAGHAYRGWAHSSLGYMGRLLLAQNMSAVTGACMLVRRQAWKQTGGLDETGLAVAFNDIDLCLKILRAGWRVVWTPWAELMHYESVTRGPETARVDAFAAEIRCMQDRWDLELERDPAYNPNLTLIDEDWSLAWPPRRSYSASVPT